VNQKAQIFLLEKYLNLNFYRRDFMSEITRIFISLVERGMIENVLSSHAMPNIPFPTMGGKVFWDNLASPNGWKLQRNAFTGHCRILNPSNIRRAYGSEKDMEDLFKKFIK
jgi:hypothetical protein